MPEAPDLLTPQAAASYIGVTANYLAKLRMTGRGPAYRKLSARLIRYTSAELEAWLASGRRTSTSDTGAGS